MREVHGKRGVGLLWREMVWMPGNCGEGTKTRDTAQLTNLVANFRKLQLHQPSGSTIARIYSITQECFPESTAWRSMPPLQFPRHVLITGGSRGIGLAIAQLFATKGYRCTLLARNEDALKAAVATLQPLPTLQFQRALEEPTPGLEFLSDDFSTTSSDTPVQEPSQHAYIPGDITSPDFWQSRPKLTKSEAQDKISSSLQLEEVSIATTLGHYLPRPVSRYAPAASRIDVLINCAGITQSALFLKSHVDQTSSILRTNLESMMLGTRFLMRQGYISYPKISPRRGKNSTRQDTQAQDDEDVHWQNTAPQSNEDQEAQSWQPSPSPVIINLSSLLALQNGFGTVAYSASKAGILGFTRALAAEYSTHRVRVNAIVPGYIESDMTKDLDKDNIKRRIPLGRLGKPEEVAHAAFFLAENEYAHNCLLNLDGGLSAV